MARTGKKARLAPPRALFGMATPFTKFCIALTNDELAAIQKGKVNEDKAALNLIELWGEATKHAHSADSCGACWVDCSSHGIVSLFQFQPAML